MTLQPAQGGQRFAPGRATTPSDDAIRKKYFTGKGSKKYPPGDSRGWKLPEARRKIREDHQWDRRYVPVLYRPFDIREMYYVPWMVDWPRTKVMQHMLAGENLALITSRMTKGEVFKHAQVTRNIAEVICMSPKTSNNGFVFPIYLYPGVGKVDASLFSRWPKGEGSRTPNLDSDFIDRLVTAVDLHFVSDGRGDLRRSFGPENVLAYIYAVFHSTGYRERYDAQLGASAIKCCYAVFEC